MNHADEFRRVLRHGRRRLTGHLAIHWHHGPASAPVRFGFIVSKAVGGAVQRNLVRRRLRAVAAEQLAMVQPGTDIVVRALPGAAQASWATLNTEISDVLNKGRA